MDIKELKSKNDAELRKDLAALQEKSRELRFKANSQELKNFQEIRTARKTIAQIMTILAERSAEQGK